MFARTYDAASSRAGVPVASRMRSAKVVQSTTAWARNASPYTGSQCHAGSCAPKTSSTVAGPITNHESASGGSTRRLIERWPRTTLSACESRYASATSSGTIGVGSRSSIGNATSSTGTSVASR